MKFICFPCYIVYTCCNNCQRDTITFIPETVYHSCLMMPHDVSETILHLFCKNEIVVRYSAHWFTLKLFLPALCSTPNPISPVNTSDKVKNAIKMSFFFAQCVPAPFFNDPGTDAVNHLCEKQLCYLPWGRFGRVNISLSFQSVSSHAMLTKCNLLHPNQF